MWFGPLKEGARRDCALGGGSFDELAAAKYHLLNWWRSGIDGEILTGWGCAQPGNVAHCLLRGCMNAKKYQLVMWSQKFEISGVRVSVCVRERESMCVCICVC